MDPDDINQFSLLLENVRDSIAAVTDKLAERLSRLTDELRTANLLALLPHLDDPDRAATLTAARRRLTNALLLATPGVAGRFPGGLGRTIVQGRERDQLAGYATATRMG